MELPTIEQGQRWTQGQGGPGQISAKVRAKVEKIRMELGSRKIGELVPTVSSQSFLRLLRFLAQLCHFFWARSEGAVFRDQRGDQVAGRHVESIIESGAALRR